MSNVPSPSNTAEFASWYERVAPGVTGRIVAMVGDPVSGRELAAEAFARAFERWGRVRKMESPEGWVYQTARNLWRSRWRRRGIERRALAKLAGGETPVVLDEHDVSDDVLVAGASTEELAAAVGELPERVQIAVRLRYWDGLTEAQVARHMGVSTGTASAMLSQGRARLRQSLATSATNDQPHQLDPRRKT